MSDIEYFKPMKRYQHDIEYFKPSSPATLPSYNPADTTRGSPAQAIQHRHDSLGRCSFEIMEDIKERRRIRYNKLDPDPTPEEEFRFVLEGNERIRLKELEELEELANSQNRELYMSLTNNNTQSRVELVLPPFEKNKDYQDAYNDMILTIGIPTVKTEFRKPTQTNTGFLPSFMLSIFCQSNTKKYEKLIEILKEILHDEWNKIYKYTKIFLENSDEICKFKGEGLTLDPSKLLEYVNKIPRGPPSVKGGHSRRRRTGRRVVARRYSIKRTNSTNKRQNKRKYKNKK